MNFFGKGKKGGKKRQQPGVPEPAIDFSSPDAFSEENMAKVTKLAGMHSVCYTHRRSAHFTLYLCLRCM